MQSKRLIGRQPEKQILAIAARSTTPEFIAVYGRRRVGKTFLIREFFSDSICFEIVGIHGASLSDQLDNFAQALDAAMGMGIPPQRPSSWMDAFRQLRKYFEASKGAEKGKRVVFLDELPWLNTPRSKFLSSLEHFWNSWGSRQNDLILVVCGSAASWMLQHVVRATGGLHNRLTQRIRLLPFTLSEAETFLKSKGLRLTRMQIVELYMSVGGVPHYLNQAIPSLSATQIIDRTCFSDQGMLRDEFETLYASLFTHSDQHRSIVRALRTRREGLARNDVLAAAGLPSGGSASTRLEELEASGFIESRIPFGKKANEVLFRLSDEYSLFYLDWIERLGKRSPGDGYWMKQRNTPRKRSWAGYAFESLCLKHTQRLKAALGISGVETAESAWRFRPGPGSEKQGVQIDLLIDRRDDTINLCEMKFTEGPFTIDKKCARDLRRKKEVFIRETGTRKNVFLTLVAPYGITDNAHAKELVDAVVTLEDLFD